MREHRSQYRINDDARTVDVNFNIEGEKVRIGRIEVVGNDRTRDKVIRREVRLCEGECFSATALKEAKD